MNRLWYFKIPKYFYFGKNTAVKDSACEGSGVESLHCLSESTYHHKQNVGRNTSIKGTSGEGSEGNEEHLETGGKAILAI